MNNGITGIRNQQLGNESNESFVGEELDFSLATLNGTNATYDGGTGRINLDSAGGTSISEAKQAFSVTPPSGANQAIYVFRHWLDWVPNAQGVSSVPPYDDSQHYGVAFTSTHPTKSANIGLSDSELAYTDFCGAAQYATSLSMAEKPSITSVDSDAIRDDYAIFGYNSGTISSRTMVGSGNGDATSIASFGVNTVKLVEAMPFTYPVDSTIGQTATYVFQVYSAVGNEGVYFKAWVNTDSIDLSTFDITQRSSLDPDNPQTSIPVSNSWEIGPIAINNGSTTGTNWRPSSGVMAFPTYFMAKYAITFTSALILDYAGVQYSTI